MKQGIHPENYRPVVFKDMSNGDMFLSRSTCKTTETIEKITWGLAIAVAVLSLAATMSIPRHTVDTEISTEVDVNAAKSVTATPAATSNVPVATDVAPEPTAE